MLSSPSVPTMEVTMRVHALTLAALLLASCNRDAPADNEVAPVNTATPTNSAAPASASAAKPSFDCARADGQAQELVCNDANLAAMDRELDRLYKLAEADTSTGEARLVELRNTQRGWVKGRDDCWKDDDLRQCVMTAYAERIHRIRQSHQAARADVPEGISIGPVAFACKGLDALIGATFVNSDPGAVFLEWGPDMAMALDHVRSGSGARYEGRVNGQAWQFWNKGREATLSWPGRGDLACTQEEIG